ncbi:MAG: hypothetical protein WAX77_10635 [Methylococcaceae bacterium]
MLNDEDLNLLAQYVRSIFCINKKYKDNKTPEFIGSGFLLKEQDNLYLITAAHVVDHYEVEHSLLLDGDNGHLVAISGNSICSPLENIERKYDKIDISVVKLSDETQAKLQSTKFFELKHLDVIDEHDPKLGYCVVGIPNNRGNERINRNEEFISPDPYSFYAEESNLETYEKMGVTKSTNLILRFNSKKVCSREDEKRVAPSLRGLSGAPVFGFKNKSESEIEVEPVPFIVAVLIEHHQKGINAVLTTKICKALSLKNEFHMGQPQSRQQ